LSRRHGGRPVIARPADATDTTEHALRQLLTPEGLADPYALYRELREREASGDPIGRVVVRHEQVSAALTDRSMSCERIPGLVASLPDEVRSQVSVVERTLGDIIAFRDPPAHTRLRRLLAKAFTPGVVGQERLAIERAAGFLIDAIADDGETDLHGRVTYPLPAMVIGALLGVPDAELERFQRWALDIVFFVGSGQLGAELALRTRDSMLEMREYLADLVGRRRREPGDDLLSAMIAAADEGDRLTTDEIYANSVFLMTAGHETATNMLSNGVLTLLRHEDQLARLLAAPELIETATEEMLRYESPVQVTARFVTEDRELWGRRLRAGEALILLLGAANRDPDVFDDPDRFDIGRDKNRHLAFALGPHFCLGASLARLEMQVVVPLILERLPGLALGDGEIAWQPTLSFRGPTQLPVRWG